MPEKYKLHTAAIAGYAKKIKSLIQNGEAINEADDEGRVPLLYAICGNHYNCVKLLVEHDDKDWNIEFTASVFEYVMANALLLSSKFTDETEKLRNCNIFELLINKSGMIHLQKKEQVDLLVKVALETNFLNLVRLILEKTPHIDEYLKTNKDHLLTTALDQNCSADILKLLINMGATINAFQELEKAIEKENYPAAKLLIYFILLKNPKEEKPDFIQNNVLYLDYWDQSLEEINKLTDYLFTKGIPPYKLFCDTPRSLVETCNLTLAFIDKIKSFSIFSSPFFSSPLIFRVKELEPVINERMKRLNLLDRLILSSKDENKNREIPLNTYGLWKLARYLPNQEIESLVRSTFYQSAPQSKSPKVDPKKSSPIGYCLFPSR